MTPFDANTQKSIQANSNWGAVIGAMEASGITVDISNDGWRVSDPTAAKAIIGNESAWLPFAKTAALQSVKDAVASLVTAGLSHLGITYQIDDASRQNIAAMGSLAGLVVAGVPGVQWPAGFAWISSDNKQIPMDTVSMLAFASAAADYYSGILRNGRTLKDAISAAASAADLSAVDLSSGWPKAS